MKILRLKAEGFGGLRGEFTFDPARLALIVDDNERGKSTLMAAIAAGLYGLDGDRRAHRMVTPLERWRPWDGGPYRVELEIEHAGERYTIRRDFDRGAVEVWNARGQELTPEFREGKDAFPVGSRLIGLDADEFEKCSFVRQGELDRVVPADEKARRASTLRGRLENAADTRVGDTNASEALRVLEGGLRRYTTPELEFTGTVDNAIQRLEAKHGLLASEMKTLEHDFAQIQGSLEELARLGEADHAARASLDQLEAERLASLGIEVRRRLEEDRRHRAEVKRLEAEIESLAAAAHLPANAEAQLREAVARHQEARRGLEALEARREAEIRREQDALDRERRTLEAFEGCGPEDADLAVSLAAEIRRSAEEDRRLRSEVFTVREGLASRGHDPERLLWFQQRLGPLEEADQILLRRQAEVALGYQTEVAGLEQERTAGSEALREIDALRNRWRLPGWFLLALGLAAAIAGVFVTGTGGAPELWLALLVTGAGLLLGGVALLLVSEGARGQHRAEALRRLSDAQRRVTQLRSQRAETEVDLGALAERIGYRDHVELQRDWSEYTRLIEESGPALRAQEQLGALEARRLNAIGQARVLVEKIGGGDPEPENLERIASGIRRSLVLRRGTGELEKKWEWIDQEKRVVEAQAAGYRERALNILQSAGLAYDPERSWEDHARDLRERASARTRWETLTNELLPRTAARLLSDAKVAELETHLASIEAGRAPRAGPQPPPRHTPIEIEAATRRAHQTLEEIGKRREDLRVQVGSVWNRFHAEHPEKLAQRERLERALERAHRFKQAVELALETIQSVATETHRRWAEYLNQRVSQLLGSLGTRVEQMRFGEDLDFSLRLWNGQQLARGKADLQLSAGARDQLYLAVRLAISEFLSREAGTLPLLLDDVFATSDDDRARAGMNALIEHFAREHQIILLTCHRRRYEALAQRDPELYEQRVQWLDTRSASVPRY